MKNVVDYVENFNFKYSLFTKCIINVYVYINLCMCVHVCMCVNVCMFNFALKQM